MSLIAVRKSRYFDFTSFDLKIFALLFMLIDHIGYFIFPDVVFWRYIGRLSLPIFLFCIVEGYQYTHSPAKYFQRLLGVGAVTEIGHIFLTYVLPGRTPIFDNIFWLLALCLFFLWVLDQEYKYWFLLIPVGFLAVYIPFSLPAFAMVLVFRYLNCFDFLLGYLAISFLCGFFYGYQFFMIFAYLFFLRYNGQKGYSSKYFRYFFYFFYPVHIWILYILGVIFHG